MKHFIALAVFLSLSLTAFAEDLRRQPLKDLDGYFPFAPPRTLREWDQRKEYVRRQILVAAGVWYCAASSADGLVTFTGDATQQKAAGGLWLLK